MSSLPKDITSIIGDYLEDPLKDLREEFHERLLLGDAYMEEEFLNLCSLAWWGRKVKWLLYDLVYGKPHPDLEIVNEVKYLLFRRGHSLAGFRYTHVFEIYLGGEDAERRQELINHYY